MDFIRNPDNTRFSADLIEELRKNIEFSEINVE
jgi:hypothetical protein